MSRTKLAGWMRWIFPMPPQRWSVASEALADCVEWETSNYQTRQSQGASDFSPLKAPATRRSEEPEMLASLDSIGHPKHPREAVLFKSIGRWRHKMG